MLSVTCKTAIKAVIYLASKYETEENAGIREIAENINASEHTVGKILQTLVKKNIINSVKGPSGGFYISREQGKQPLMRIVDAVDGKEIFKECVLGLSRCSASHPCPIHHEYKLTRDLMEKMFTTKNVADLCQFVNNGIAHLIG
jgi:Rrf2 family protein